ncbi:MAG TPA: PEP-CTERM sorting domain-containing protein [Candidatus Aquabacterium excrementipullorum]|nr:PEP-CTERM sorting domain-containing protein [Candidatus Aquabacterium excrementipullorum]
MKFNVKSLVAASIIATAGLAQAGTITALPGETHQGLTLVGGNAVLSFSSSLVTALNVGKVVFTSVAPAAVNEVYTAQPPFGSVRTGVTANAPLSFMTVDDTTGDVLAAGSRGGATLTIAPLAGVSTGGSITVANLSVDLTQKRVYADLTGNFSGVSGASATTLQNFYLWDFASLTGPTNVQVGAGSYTNVISGLKITQAGLNNFASALGLIDLGLSTIKGVSDYGSITSTIVAQGTLVMPSVPEPGTWAMMGLGFAGMALAARRRRRAD